MGGKPTRGTKADRRLTRNRPKPRGGRKFGNGGLLGLTRAPSGGRHRLDVL